ncbi:histone H4 transcription factor [Onthophagus taurus]|uniref:histone H4 transcription factor n=1 Tax=Onthophagus taurus TaxID=166361 RepID=UPI000C20936D|nr:histone H4 transcription factor [Onthophagus taurus]
MGEALTNKRKSRLAVFEHLPTDSKKVKRDGNSAPSTECRMIINEEELQTLIKPRNRGVRLVEEPLQLLCKWTDCTDSFTDYSSYMKHVNNHVLYLEASGSKVLKCLWGKCDITIDNIMGLLKHVSFHAYHNKLKSIGENMVGRLKLPKCYKSEEFTVPGDLPDFNCDWGTCDKYFVSINDFQFHIKLHVNANPKYCKKGESIDCQWRDCKLKLSSQYKLSDHMRSHTKERVVACPTCGTMFATKTKFCDHRKRQLPLELQSYQCSQCSKLFSTERLLRDHMRAHINHYKCNFCDMTCPKPSNLAKHIRFRHMNERPFKCNLCKHSCVSKDHLEQHLTTHCGEKLMACDECDFRCRSLYGLERHYQKEHGNGWTHFYECHCCLKRFSRGNQLTKHLISVHDYHWPSGHSRFRYKEDTDGILRLQTVRYESLEVTQEMIESNNQNSTTDPKRASKHYVLMTSETGEEKVVCSTDNNVVITIADVDAKGHVVKSETMESNEMCVKNDVRLVKKETV